MLNLDLNFGAQMNQYIIDTKYAAEHLIAILQRENRHLEEKLTSFKMMKDAEKNLFEQMKEEHFTPEGVIDLYGFGSAANHFEHAANQIVLSLTLIEDSLAILAGALLQIAKQGISITHGSLANCPQGRVIGREAIKNIIWQGRNQAMHFEEGKYSPKVIECFKNLEADYGSRFKLADKNLAHEIVNILGWISYDRYECDIMQLLS